MIEVQYKVSTMFPGARTELFNNFDSDRDIDTQIRDRLAAKYDVPTYRVQLLMVRRERTEGPDYYDLNEMMTRLGDDIRRCRAEAADANIYRKRHGHFPEGLSTGALTLINATQKKGE